MGIRSFFHKVKTGIVRIGQPSIPYTPQEKKFGNDGENQFSVDLHSALPDCRIKKNIIITTEEGNAEIDCLVLYRNKLFAIEIKRWLGNIIEKESSFVQEKPDRWTGEIHTRVHKSPFKQINRAVYLLRRQVPYTVWVNSIVFFAEASNVRVYKNQTFFSDIEAMAQFIANKGTMSDGNCANSFFEHCVSADILYSSSWSNSLQCLIAPNSLQIQTSSGLLTRKDITSIRIVHHWSYDTLQIYFHGNMIDCVDLENQSILATVNGRKQSYALCKLDYIEIGTEFI